MKPVFSLLLMIFCHIVDDFYLQGLFINLKQKSWWQKQAPEKKYQYDYCVALVLHGFSWAFMIMLPIAYAISWQADVTFFVVFCFNWAVHGIVDDLKANKLKINLITDQTIHIVQIIITWLMFQF